MPINESELETLFHNARDLIASGGILTLDDLYGIITKKAIAEGLGAHSVSFTNYKANRPETLRLSEIMKLSELLETDVHQVLAIFLKSIR